MAGVLMYWLVGLLIIAIGLRDAYTGHYKKNPFISPKYPITRRYIFSVLWVLVGIATIISGVYVP